MPHRYLSLIWEELGKGKVEERPLQEKRPRKKAIRGWCDGEHAVVNPIPDTCDTLIHELLHRRFPDWSERTVKARTTEMIRRLTPEEMRAIYLEYSAVKVPKRSLTVDD